MMKEISIETYISEINVSLNNKNYLSALSVALMIPDICRKISNDDLGYVEWFNKYVYKDYYNFPKMEQIEKNSKAYELYEIKLNGNVCYALRNSILHTGTSSIEIKKRGQKECAKIDQIELCINGKSDRNSQYGEAVSITDYNRDNKIISIRINIIILINSILKGYEKFKEENKKTYLFTIIDWDN